MEEKKDMNLICLLENALQFGTISVIGPKPIKADSIKTIDK